MIKKEVLEEYEELQKLEEKLRQVARDIKNKKHEKVKLEKKKKDMMVEGYVEEKGVPTMEMSAVSGDIRESGEEIEKLQVIRDGLVERISEQQKRFDDKLECLKNQELKKLDEKEKNLISHIERLNEEINDLCKQQKEVREMMKEIDKDPDVLIEEEARNIARKPEPGELVTEQIRSPEGEGKTIIVPGARRRNENG